MTFWSIFLGLPVLAFGGVALFSPSCAKKCAVFFRDSSFVALPLTVAGWFFTAYECDIIGIDAFDTVTKAFPGELWILAAVLSFLTFAWMRPNLSTRALSGLLMLLPAEFFKVAHAYRPDAGVAFAPFDAMIALVYLAIAAGMYGMFYPWRIEKAASIAFSRDWSARALGGFFAASGAAFMAIGVGLG